MNQHQASLAKPRATRKWVISLAVVAALGFTGVAGASIAGEAFGGMHGMHGKHGGRGHAMDPAKMEQHVTKMIDRIAPDATAQQKARLNEIAKQAIADLHPMHKEFREGKKKAHALLLQPQIDRRALEVLRVDQMQKADAMSKRMVQAVADAAEILTPEQRKRLADHMHKRMR